MPQIVNPSAMTSPAHPSVVLSYAGEPRGRTYEAWSEDVRRRLIRLDIQPSDGERVNCKLEITPLASLILASPGGTSAQFSRTRALLSDSCDDLVLIAATAGRIAVTQNQRLIELRESQMCLADMAVQGSVVLDQESQFTTIRIPRRELLSISPKAQNRLSMPLLENVALRNTITRYFTLASEMAPHLAVVEQNLAAQHLTDLVAMLLGTGPDEAEMTRIRGLSAAQLQLLKAEVLKSLGDGTLKIDLIARRCGVSPRHVQRLFEQAGTTFSEFVLEHRLLLARRLLTNPGNRLSKISTIAYDAGFADISYFNRAFRRRFEATPSELRNPG